MKLSHQSLSRSVSPTQKTYQCINEYKSAVQVASDYIKASMRIENNLVSTLKMGSKQQSLKKIYENVGILIADMAHQRGRGNQKLIRSTVPSRQISPFPVNSFVTNQDIQQPSPKISSKPDTPKKQSESIEKPEASQQDIEPEISFGQNNESKSSQNPLDNIERCQACNVKIKIKYSDKDMEVSKNQSYCSIKLTQQQVQLLQQRNNIHFQVKNKLVDGKIEIILCKKCYLKLLSDLYDNQIDQIMEQNKNNQLIPDIPIISSGCNDSDLVNNILDHLLIKPKHKCNCQNGYKCKCGCCYPLHTHQAVECPNKEMDKYQIQLENYFKHKRSKTVDEEIKYFLNEFPELRPSYEQNQQTYSKIFNDKRVVKRQQLQNINYYNDENNSIAQNRDIPTNIPDKYTIKYDDEARMSQIWNRKMTVLK